LSIEFSGEKLTFSSEALRSYGKKPKESLILCQSGRTRRKTLRADEAHSKPIDCKQLERGTWAASFQIHDGQNNEAQGGLQV
jgi:hypothetical protein